MGKINLYLFKPLLVRFYVGLLHNTILTDRKSDLQVLFKHGENSEWNRTVIFAANHAEFKEMSPSN